MPVSKAMLQAPVNDDVPVTRGMLTGVRTELIERIDATRAELKAEIHDVKAGLARIEALLGEQKAQSGIFLDVMTVLRSRQDQVERRMDHVEETVRALAAR